MARLTFAQMTADHRVSDWSDERPGSGIWLYLTPGWVTGEGLLTIHETTVRECSNSLQEARYSPTEWIQALQDLQSLEFFLEEMLPGN
jgi:hypothetical protein